MLCAAMQGSLAYQPQTQEHNGVLSVCGISQLHSLCPKNGESCLQRLLLKSAVAFVTLSLIW